jgi:hypothetical protein
VPKNREYAYDVARRDLGEQLYPVQVPEFDADWTGTTVAHAIGKRIRALVVYLVNKCERL